MKRGCLLDGPFFVSYGHEVFFRHKAPLTVLKKKPLQALERLLRYPTIHYTKCILRLVTVCALLWLRTNVAEWDRETYRFRAESGLAVAYRGLCTNSGQASGWLRSMVEPVASSIRARGDKNKIVVLAFAFRSDDYGDRATPSGRHAWGVFVYTKTHLAFGKIGLFYELLHRCILG
jgi:hypothetical protein